MIRIPMPDLSKKSWITHQVEINKQVFDFTFKWSLFNSCCFLTIKKDSEIIQEEIALVNNRVIINDKRILPQLFFTHQSGLNFEPIKETFSNYVIEYEI